MARLVRAFLFYGEVEMEAGTIKKLLLVIALILLLMAAAGWSFPLLAGIQVGWLGLFFVALAQLI